MMLYIRITLILAGLVLLGLEFFPVAVEYLKKGILKEPQYTGKLVAGGLIFFIGIYLGKGRSKKKRYGDTAGMSDVNEGPDED